MGGAFWWHIGLAWGLQLAAQKAKRNGDEKVWKEIRNSLEDKSYLQEGPDLLKKYDSRGMVNQWFEESNKANPIWKTHKPLKTWLQQPILLIGGWWDPHLRGILDLYEKSLIVGGQPDLHIGPASHLRWWEEVQQIHLDFFNKYLQPSNTLKVPSSRQQKLWNITSKKWFDLQPIDTRNRIWHLSTGGNACIDSTDGELTQFGKGQGELSIVHDPWRPVSSIGGHLSPDPGIANRAEIDKRNDVATFTSKPLEERIQLKGVPKLEIIAMADRNGFDLCVAISIIQQNSKEVLQISTGVLRLVGNKAKSTLKRNVTLQPLFADIHKGDRLRLSISGAAWPAIAINPGDPSYNCGSPSPYCLVTTISLELSQAKLEICPLFSK
ncbi:CocE/NonD family hydrolase [Prochlorococcus marinus]|uniref:Xaa-Pro dipeptidyl-peptidase C-terminal domain-containing protein n=1 Tax=Prochlorococcus marinus (strain MIT 9211) TaxID=93059 RepID=A9BAY6_PROM4|nr:Hypothetical protein P9211_10671 [Prochlorococcus marinus str. MIT 9211]